MVAPSVSSVEVLKHRVSSSRDDIIQFMRDICAIPSMDGQLKEVGERIGAEMTKLGFEEVRFDKMGNILGRIGPSLPSRAQAGSGQSKRVIVYDSHIDTVGVGDPAELGLGPVQGQGRR
jgi:acetylornithine deacetylase/succinyl-diaminopimelate desuccinylase-like protein